MAPRKETAGNEAPAAPKETTERKDAAERKPVRDLQWTPPTLEEARAMPLGLALTCARNEYKEIRKTQEGQIQNRKYKYADLADILEAVNPTLARYGIEIFNETVIENVSIREEKKDDSRRRSRDDEPVQLGDVVEESWIMLAITAKKGGEDSCINLPICRVGEKPQLIGANLTYMRRYGLQLVLGISPDDDTDGQSPNQNESNSRREDRRYDPREDERRDDRWRDNPPRDERGEGERDEQHRRDERKDRQEPELSNMAKNHIDMIRSAGNMASCENFWKMFKDKNPSEYDFQIVKDIYKARYKQLRDSDPLNMDNRSREDGNQKNDEKPAAREPDVPLEDEHMSPEEMIRAIEKELNNVGSVEEYDEWVRKNKGLLDAATQFPPDAEAVNDMMDATLNRVIASGGRGNGGGRGSEDF